MLANQRRDLIVDQVRRDGSVLVRQLAVLFDVSEMTIRRDLDALAELRLVDKVHGGAIRVGPASSFEPGFDAKRERQTNEKDAIARSARDFVEPGSAIGVTAGTTTWRFAQLLRDISDLTVVTNAPAIARSLYELGEHSVVLTGGVRTPSDALVGPLATRALATLHVDVLFLGVHGIDTGLGFSTPNLAEADVNRAFIDAARRVVVLADHTKWGIRGLAQIAPLSRADVVISDDALPVDARAELTRAGVEVVIAGGSTADRRVG